MKKDVWKPVCSFWGAIRVGLTRCWFSALSLSWTSLHAVHADPAVLIQQVPTAESLAAGDEGRGVGGGGRGGRAEMALFFHMNTLIVIFYIL